MKQKIADFQTLFFVDDNADVFLHTDACNFGIGAYCFQLIEGKEQPIAFYSKALAGAQLRWSTIEQECYAILMAFREFDYLLRHRHFFLRTDHLNLIYMNDSRNAKVVRWKMEMQEFDFAVEHIAGVKNVVADGLSRFIYDHAAAETEVPARVACLRIASVTDNTGNRPVLLQPETWEPVATTLARIHVPLEKLELDDDRYTLISRFHNALAGHGGVEKTVAMMKAAGIDDVNLRNDCTRFVRQCATCQKNRPSKTRGRVTPFVLSSVVAPMRNLSLDSAGPFPEDDEGYNTVTLAICDMTRYTTLHKAKDATGASAARSFMNHVGTYGMPDRIRSDGGPQFISNLFEELMAIGLVEHSTTTPYSHEENGIVERSIKTFLEHLRALLFDKEIKNRWSDYLPMIQRIMNSSVHSRLGCSPADILFSNSIDINAGFTHPRRDGEEIELTIRQQNVLDSQTMLIDKVQKMLESSDSKALARRSEVQLFHENVVFEPDSFVLIHYPDFGRPPNKLMMPLAGPFRVVRTEADTLVIQDLLTVSDRTRRIHISRAVPFNYDPKREKPQVFARRDNDSFLVEAVLDHTDSTPPNSKTKPLKSCLEFKVRWTGYEAEHDLWLPWSELRSTFALHKYLHSKGLDAWIPREFRRGNYDISFDDLEDDL